MPRNPENMRPTMASRADIVVRSNQIVAMETFIVMEEARLAENAVLYEAAQNFLNYPIPKKRKYR